MKFPKFLICLVCFFFCSILFFASDFSSVKVTDSDTLFAQEEFRRGVQSFYRGSYNEAILLFETALSYLPSENLILEWLGKAYYYAGLEGAALQHWQLALDNGYGDILLSNKIEIIKERRVIGEPHISTNNYVEAGSYPGVVNDTLIFSQPTALLPNSDGTTWVVGYGSNELLLIDANGFIAKRIRGPLTGFDRPMDIIRVSNGNILISEFAGDRISVLDSKGNYISSFGTKGVSLGQLVGPQFLAIDSSDNVYVSDFGNARIDVFDKNGKPLFYFGRPTEDFKGFKAPAGIAIYQDTIYVADAISGAIYSFDRAGNYNGLLVPEKTFSRPESMRVSGDYIIITDSNKICTIDLSNGAVFENARTGSAPSRVMSAYPNINGNLLVTDFISNEVYVMSDMKELIGGMFVQIERIVTDKFPLVTMEVKVENRQRQPIVGLKTENFYVTENQNPVLEQKLLGAAANNDVCDITLILDRSVETALYDEALTTAVKDVVSAMNGIGNLTVISAGDIPTIEYIGSPSDVGNFDIKSLKSKKSSECATDLAIRLAANGLLNGEKKRAIIYLTGASNIGTNSFKDYSLSELSAYLNNNSIAFYTVNLSQNVLPDEIVYLTESTNGNSLFVYRPEGVAPVVKDVLALPNGLYQISYISSLPTNFGRDYLPVEIEVYLLNRSGRDETGYFPPLE